MLRACHSVGPSHPVRFSGQRLSRDDWKKKKELEELRKTGAAPAEVDEDGNMINPHIPQYISQAPWYLNNTNPGLKHQKKHNEDPHFVGLQDWYKRGLRQVCCSCASKLFTVCCRDGLLCATDFSRQHQSSYHYMPPQGPAAIKYRKGACENCGALTHSKKDCTERPRARGAKWTNSQIAPDEVIQSLELSYDAKRDRWNGYDAAQHQQTIFDREYLVSVLLPCFGNQSSGWSFRDLWLTCSCVVQTIRSSRPNRKKGRQQSLMQRLPGKCFRLSVCVAVACVCVCALAARSFLGSVLTRCFLFQQCQEAQGRE